MITDRLPAHTPRPVVEVLAGIAAWGAEHAAASVFSRAGVLAAHGPTDRIFAVASITKLVTALSVLIAVEEETLDLDGPLGPDGSTLRHVMAHASGLAFDSFDVLAAPGSRRIYSNSGYELLANDLERRSGIRFADYLGEAVLEPLGMTDSALDGSAAAGLTTTVDDLVLLGIEMLSPTLVDSGTFSGAISPQFPDLAGVVPGWGRHDPCPWGLGPELKGSKQPHWMGSLAGPTTFGHFGGSGTMLFIDPIGGFGCVALSDRAFGSWALDLWPRFCDDIRLAISGIRP